MFQQYSRLINRICQSASLIIVVFLVACNLEAIPTTETAPATQIPEPDYETLRSWLLKDKGYVTAIWGDEDCDLWGSLEEWGCPSCGDCKHPGIDFGTGGKFEKVYTVASGKITGSGGVTGKLCIHNEQTKTTFCYLHLSTIEKTSGYVNQGELIGRVGKEGAGSVHLHFEARRDYEGVIESGACCFDNTIDPLAAAIEARIGTDALTDNPLSSTIFPTNTPNPTITPSPTAFVATSGISGQLYYPGESIPPLRIVAFNIVSGEWYSTETAGVYHCVGELCPTETPRAESAPDPRIYTIDNLPPGTYHVVAYPLGEGNNSGGYSRFVLCGLSVNCTDHSLVDVQVESGEITMGIDLADWYAPPGSFPNYPTHLPVVSPTSASTTPPDSSSNRWPLYRHDAQHSSVGTYLGPGMPELKWTFYSGGTISPPVISADGIVYINSTNGTLYALDTSGSEKWTYPLAGDGFAELAIMQNGTILAGKGNTLYAFDSGGTLKWTNSLEQNIDDIVLGPDDTIFVSSNCLHAFYPDGTQIWDEAKGICNDIFDFKGLVVSLGGNIFGLSALEVNAFSPEGTLMWSEQTALVAAGIRGFNTAITLDSQGYVYINARAGSAAKMALPIATLTILNPWGGFKQYPDGSQYVKFPPAITSDGTIYLGMRETGQAYTIDDSRTTSELGPLMLQAKASNGSLLWSVVVENNDCSYPVVDANGNVYFIFSNGDLHAYDPNGNIRWIFNIGESKKYCRWPGWNLAIGDKTIYLSTESTLYAIGESDEELEAKGEEPVDEPTLTSQISSCPGLLSPRLWANGYAYVNPEPPMPNLVRLAPDTDRAAVGQIPPGEIMEVLYGPECAEGYTWWKVRAIDTGIVGWTVEGDNVSYWLVPCETKTSCGSQ